MKFIKVKMDDGTAIIKADAIDFAGYYYNDEKKCYELEIMIGNKGVFPYKSGIKTPARAEALLEELRMELEGELKCVR